MTTDTVKNAKMTTELVVNFVFFETLTTEKSATDWQSDSTTLIYSAEEIMLGWRRERLGLPPSGTRTHQSHLQ